MRHAFVGTVDMTIAGYPLTPLEIALMVIVCFFVGFTKTGIMGMNVLITPLALLVLKRKVEPAIVTATVVGLLLPMMVFADSLAVIRYRQHANWKIIARLLPWVIPGLFVGAATLVLFRDKILLPMLGCIILVIIALYFIYEYRKDWIERNIPHSWWFAAGIGLLAGFVTMIGNISGAIMTVFMLSVGLQKNEFMGTSAWFYAIVNVTKIPILIAASYWLKEPLISSKSLLFDVVAIPVIAAGAMVGIWTFRIIPQKLFYGLMLFLAALGALKLIFAA